MTEHPETAADDRTIGKYRLVRRLGRGGFGEVFLGEDPDGRRVALKLLHDSWASDPDARRRFAQEVTQARRVSGFCTADILDADPDAATPWIASEYIDGPTLLESVRADGPRHGADLHRLAVSTATALTAIHAAGVVHRDLKPENIMLAADGPRVIDFGIARAVETTSVTASGVVGTIGYMAPEQLEGSRLTAAVDIFAWGAVMVYAATGQEAFAAPTQAARIARILAGEPDTGDLGGPLLPIVLACLEKAPDARPSARTLMDWLVTGPPTRDTGGGAPAEDGAATADPSHVPTSVVPPTPPTTVESPVAPTTVESPLSPTAVAPATPPTRVDPGASAPGIAEGGTLAYTHATPPAGTAGINEASHHPQLPADPDRGTVVAPPGGGEGEGSQVASTLRPGTGSIPPYWFAGEKYIDARELAAAMQLNWGEAVRVFANEAERDMLGSWMVDDAGDTTVDRSVFRRKPEDVNQTVAWFVAQLRPDLPPVFRGQDASVDGLRELFADVRPLFTGAPPANEMLLLARPAVLRTMALYHGPDSDLRRQLGDDLKIAESAGVSFLEQLREQLSGWRQSRPVYVDPGLIVAYLLRPGQIEPPDSNGDDETRKLFHALWQRVERAQGPERAGYAAAVHAAASTVRTMAAYRRSWHSELEQAHVDLDQARTRWIVQRVLHVLKILLFVGGCVLAPIALFTPFRYISTEPESAQSVLFSLVFYDAVLFGGAFLISMTTGATNGYRTRRHFARAWKDHASARVEQLKAGIDEGDRELERTREICSG
ncbi:serine/threonine protein kinase [Nocardiopsis gilva YIM 90087]|uniref:Serine/threonine protein kinase n=1 Tax=Nocardiopsis gilva YIM 90087 TaxID=1235441 RepID=A0A223S8L7_9ACTN|nr:serine/threonine-protein kinase [Nocardiopsis gilva]ASU84465.1 serine/threonine protein kinase [Nocardiopsis gilva YIM 90087]